MNENSFEMEKIINNIKNGENVEENIKLLTYKVKSFLQLNNFSMRITDESDFYGIRIYPKLSNVKSYSLYLYELIKNKDRQNFSSYLPTKNANFDKNPKSILYDDFTMEIDNRIFESYELSDNDIMKFIFTSISIYKREIDNGFDSKLETENGSISDKPNFDKICQFMSYINYKPEYKNLILSILNSVIFVLCEFNFNEYYQAHSDKIDNDGFTSKIKDMQNVNTREAKPIKDFVYSMYMIDSLNDLMNKKKFILNELDKQLSCTSNPIEKDLLQSQINEFTKLKGTINPITESNNKLIEESVRSYFEIKKKGLSYLELDEIEVEIAQAETNEDKIYLISRIYRDITMAEKVRKKLEKKYSTDSSMLSDIDEFIIQLKDLLERVRKIKISKDEKLGSVYLKLPEGDYEFD